MKKIIWFLKGTIYTSFLVCKEIYNILNQLGLDVMKEIEEMKKEEEKKVFKNR